MVPQSQDPPNQGQLIDTGPSLPEGLLYQPDFLSALEERELLNEIERVEFSDVRMHGVVAKRRVAHFGLGYAYDKARATEGPPMAEFLLPLRERSAELIDVPPDELAEALVTYYPTGAPIGWHRDAPMFGTVIGISLLGSCRFRFRRGETRAWETVELRVDPRSVYVLSGEARAKWQHSIPPTKEPRYSITFRTLRRKPG